MIGTLGSSVGLNYSLFRQTCAGQVRHPSMQLHLFTKKMRPKSFQSAPSQTSAFSFTFPNLYNQHWSSVDLFFSSQMFILPVDRDKTNPHFFPPFCLPESVTPLYPWYTFKSNIKCTLKCRQHFSCVLARDQAGQDCSIQMQRFTEQALVSALVKNHRFIES